MDTEEVPFPCPLFGNISESRKYELIVVNIRVCVASISFIGSLFVMTLIWLFKKHKFFTQRLILYLGIASFLSSIAYILGHVEYDPNDSNSTRFCKFSGFLLFYTDWTVLLTTLAITFNLLLRVTYKMRSERFEIGYIVLSFGIPLFIVWIPFVLDAFGPSGAWCWIRSKYDNCDSFYDGKVLQFSLWYFPLYLTIAILFLMYLLIVVKVRLQIRKWEGVYNPQVYQQQKLLKEEIKPLVWYPVIYFAVQLFPLINRIVVSADAPNFTLFVLHVTTSPLTGALIALAYALDRETIRRLNWRSIRANLCYRSSDQVVNPYDIKETQEEEFEKSTYLLYDIKKEDQFMNDSEN